MRLGSFVCREGGNCGGLQLAYLFPWTTHLACFQPMPAGVGKWDSGVSWMEGGGREHLCNPVEMGVRKEMETSEVFYLQTKGR